jgi:hypothetical protein
VGDIPPLPPSASITSKSTYQTTTELKIMVLIRKTKKLKLSKVSL